MILGIGSAAPDKVLTNFDLEKMVDTSDQWIRERSGIERRHILEDGKANSDMATKAARNAISHAKLKPKDIDCIILATISPDMLFPATACKVQDNLGATHAVAFDISAACSGFIYALHMADSFITSQVYRHVLIIGSEVLSRFVDWEDRTTCVLFGDGAGAAVIGPSDGERGILSSFIRSDGKLTDLLCTPGGGSLHPASIDTINQGMHFLKMMGREVFKHAVRTMVDAARHGLDLAGFHSDDIDLLITHQANIRIIHAVASRLKLPDEKVFVNLQEYGNTSAASIPLAMDQAKNEGRLKAGDHCLLVAFGGGFTWASSLIRF